MTTSTVWKGLNGKTWRKFTYDEYRDSNIENEIDVTFSEPIKVSYLFKLHSSNGEKYLIMFSDDDNHPETLLIHLPEYE